ncbi:MAG: trehalose-6-phosphate synthase, partial [Anaerolineae bacterium]|nr:trehalose-6-phosphate synthase [Anaerolineae bacterium]
MTTQAKKPLDEEYPHDQPLIVVASNRGPFSFTAQPGGKFEARRGAGGLVTALSGIAERYGILWIAAALDQGDAQWAAQHPAGAQVEEMRLRLLALDPKRYNLYYNVVANPLLWFIQHQLWDIPRTPSIDAETWQAWYNGYVHVNRQFAEAIADSVAHVR